MSGETQAAVDHALARLGQRARPGVALGPLTTYRVGGPAAVFVRAEDEADLAAVAAVRAETGLPVLVVGKGSNLLVADAGFPGIAIVLGPAFEEVEVAGVPVVGEPPAGEVAAVRAGGAASLPVLARRSAAAGWRGLEWAVGVPGSVGGAVRMNAGGHGSDMAACLASCRVFDLRTGEPVVWRVGDLDYAYRHSSITTDQVVTSARLRALPGDPGEALAVIEDIVRWRREHQPGGRNAGSVFTNPPDDSAGRLVEAAGCKGRRHGSAVVSEKHANFIQADDDGSADDVFALIEEVVAVVEAQTGVRLGTEIRLIGFPGTYPHEVPDPRGSGRS